MRPFDPQANLSCLQKTDPRYRAGVPFSVEVEMAPLRRMLSTALRLAELYGLRKFVILVHSIAIRAGVVKTFERTDRTPPGIGVPYKWGVLRELGIERLRRTVGYSAVSGRECAGSGQTREERCMPVLSSRSYGAIHWAVCSRFRRARPVVLIDEPQNMATPLRRQAIATLSPLVALRYSATRKNRSALCIGLDRSRPRCRFGQSGCRSKGIVAGEDGKPYIRLDRLRSVL